MQSTCGEPGLGLGPCWTVEYTNCRHAQLSVLSYSASLASEEVWKFTENGPILAKADKIVKKAMDKYCKANESGEWHFIRKQSEGKLFKSKVLDRLQIESSRLGFMDA